MAMTLLELQVVEARQHELQAEAEHERLVKAALKLRRAQGRSSRLARYLDALRGRNPDRSKPHEN